jgi:hypothetical protein
MSTGVSRLASVRQPGIRQRAAALGTSTVLMVSSVLATTGILVSPVPVAAASPVTITNTGSPNPVISGEQLSYAVVVTNTGGRSSRASA